MNKKKKMLLPPEKKDIECICVFPVCFSFFLFFLLVLFKAIKY